MNMEKRKEHLKRVLTNGNGLKRILDEASAFLGNPILMIDVTYKLLASSENTVGDDVLWNEILSLGRFSHDSVNFFREEKFIETYAASETAMFMKSPKLKYNRASSVVFGEDGGQLGSICMPACYKPISLEDCLLLDTVSEALFLELKLSGEINNLIRPFEENIINALIEKAPSKSDAIKRDLQDIYSDLKPNLYVAVVDIMQYDRSLTHLAYFKEHLKSIQPEYKYFIYLNNVIIIMGTDSPVFNVESELGKLGEFFKANQLYSGISNSFQDLYGFKEHYRRAINALNYGISLNNGRNIFKYDDFRGELFLAKHLEHVNVRDICHPVVFLIQDYDAQNNTKHLETLYCYMQKGGIVKLASEVAGLSSEQFQNRLDEICKQFGIDHSNGDMLASIFRSIKLLKTFPEHFK